MTKGQFTDSIVRWLNQRMAPAGVVIDSETELFAGGLIDSLRVLELIAWTERETGRAIPDRQIRMDNFRTPRRIAEVFMPQGRVEAGSLDPAAAGADAPPSGCSETRS